MIDLHSHTTESDGTCTPAQLVDAACEQGLEALAITDHDTLAGYEMALPLAQARGLDLVCAIEVSTRHDRMSVHLLAYFPQGPPEDGFYDLIRRMQASRRQRNEQLAAKLAMLGMPVSLEEVYAMGRSLAGRPHFARLMLRQGYVQSMQEAFDLFLADDARAHVEREQPALVRAIEVIGQAGGVSVLAHPIRLNKRDPKAEEDLIAQLAAAGLNGIEAFHSDHSPADERRYAGYAERYGLLMTGGSDFHGENKPGVRLGAGRGNLNVPRSLLERLRAEHDLRRGAVNAQWLSQADNLAPEVGQGGHAAIERR